MHRGSWLLIAGLLLAGSACAHRRAVVSDAGTPQLADSVIVNILSHVGDRDIYAQAAGQSFFIGKVRQGTAHQFVLHQGWLWGRSVEFVTEQFRSGHFNFSPGDVISWEITMESSRATRLP
jgi:hypothetical protein